MYFLHGSSSSTWFAKKLDRKARNYYLQYVISLQRYFVGREGARWYGAKVEQLAINENVHGELML